MARCTAPSRGHRTASGAADCPACGGRSRGYSSSSYYSTTPSYQPSSTTSYSSGYSSGGRSSGGGKTIKPRWSRGGSRSRGGSGYGGGTVILYTPNEVLSLTPVRESIEKQFAVEKQLVAQHLPVPDTRDYFLCHAWDDRKEAAKELHDMLVSHGASVWFSEKDVLLGSTLLREIDKGLAKSRTGIVLVTPAFLRGLPKMGVADKELSALLAQNKLIPIVHNTTYEALREVSPLLGSRAGLDTIEDSMSDIAAKLAELAAPPEPVDHAY
jgi:hypothetical protein